MNVPEGAVAVRMPELGPSLGKLITGTGRVPGGVALDDVRIELVTAIVEAAGESRRLISANEFGAAAEVIGPDMWQSAWDLAVASVARRVVERIEAHLDAEGRAARMPRRLRRRLGLSDGERRTLAARLGAHGAPLVSALDALDAVTAGAMTPAGAERGTGEAWENALTLTSRRLEAAWLSLEEAVASEVTRWKQLAGEISRWRRSWWPVVLLGVPALAAAVWLGLVLGGYIESPAWFTSLWSAVFG